MAASKRDARTNDLVISVVTGAAALAAASVARRAARLTWRAVTGKQPPTDVRSPDTDWAVAVLWAVSSGAAVGIARLLVEREVNARIAARKS